MVLSILGSSASAGGPDTMDPLMAMALQRLDGKRGAAETMRREEKETRVRGKGGKRRRRRRRRILEVPFRVLRSRCLVGLVPRQDPRRWASEVTSLRGHVWPQIVLNLLVKEKPSLGPLGKRIQARFRVCQILCGTAHVDRVCLKVGHV